MGRILQIRVSAWTFSEDDVEKKWKSLWKLVWEEGGDAVPKKGVLELAHAVFDGVRAGLIPSDQAEQLREQADKAEELCQDIDGAINERDPKKADKLTYELEDCLDALEDIASNF